jgi:hypothetical protein
MNIYLATVADRMHHLDLGLFCYQINFTYEVLKLQHGDALVNEVNRRLAAIPRFPDLKIFSNGLHARLTASEYWNLMKVMLFVVDNLYNENDDDVDNFVYNDDLTELYEKWNKMYIISRYEEFSESDLAKFKVSKIKFLLELNLNLKFRIKTLGCNI